MKLCHAVLLIVATGILTQCKPAKEKPASQNFVDWIKQIPDLTLPLSTKITTYSPGDTVMCTQPLDSLFITTWFGFHAPEALWNLNHYTVCGKKYLADSAVMVVYTVERHGSATPVYDNTIMTFDKKGNKIDSLVLMNDICCNPDAPEENDHYNTSSYILHDNLTLRSRKSIVLGPEGDYEEIILVKTSYQIEPSGKITTIVSEYTEEGERLIADGRAGKIMLGMPVDTLQFLFANNNIKREIQQAEGNDQVVYQIYQEGLKEPAVSMTTITNNRREEISTLHIQSPNYRLGKYISVGSTFMDIAQVLNVTAIFGNEQGNVSMQVSYYPGVSILLDGTGLDAFPEKTYTIESIPAGQKVIGFYLYTSPQ